MSFTWKYFFFFNLIAALIIGVKLLVPVALFDLAGNLVQMANVFPEDLVVTADDKGLNINQELPYTIPMSQIAVEGMSDEDTDVPQNILTFTADEAIEGIQSVRDLDSIFVLTPTTVYVAGDQVDQEVRAYPIPEFEEAITLDRSSINTFIDRVVNHPFLKNKLYVPALLLASLLIVYPLILISRVVTLALYATATWVIVMLFMKKKGLGWSKIFQISMHSITPIILIAHLIGIFSFVFFHGWIYFLSYLGWTLFVISKLGNRSGVVEGEVVSSRSAKAAPSAKAKTATKTTKKSRTRK